jgi:hypothetical protein
MESEKAAAALSPFVGETKTAAGAVAIQTCNTQEEEKEK